MANIRNIKRDFFRSPSLAQCSIPSRLTFAGLWLEADSCGRGVADSRVIKGSIWPMDDVIGHDDVESHLQELSTTGHIVLYEDDGKRYFAVIAWEKHQSSTFRRSEALYPPPPDESPGSDVTLTSVNNSHHVVNKSVLEGKGREGKGREARLQTRATSAPDEWPVTPMRKEWATTHECDGLNLKREAQKFLDHHVAKGSVFKDWERAWQKWIRQAAEWQTDKAPRDMTNAGAGRLVIDYGEPMDLS